VPLAGALRLRLRTMTQSLETRPAGSRRCGIRLLTAAQDVEPIQRAFLPARQNRPDSIAKMALNGTNRGELAQEGDHAMAKRVLVAGDEPNIVMTLRFLMEREDLEVEPASRRQDDREIVADDEATLAITSLTP